MPIHEPPQSTLLHRPAIVRPAVVTYRATRPVGPMWYARPSPAPLLRAGPLPMRPVLLPAPGVIRYTPAPAANC